MRSPDPVARRAGRGRGGSEAECGSASVRCGARLALLRSSLAVVARAGSVLRRDPVDRRDDLPARARPLHGRAARRDEGHRVLHRLRPADLVVPPRRGRVRRQGHPGRRLRPDHRHDERRRGAARGRGPHLPPEGLTGQRMLVSPSPARRMHFILALVLAVRGRSPSSGSATTRRTGRELGVDPGSAAALAGIRVGRSVVVGRRCGRSPTLRRDVQGGPASPRRDVDLVVRTRRRAAHHQHAARRPSRRSSAPSARTSRSARTTARCGSTRSIAESGASTGRAPRRRPRRALNGVTLGVARRPRRRSRRHRRAATPRVRRSSATATRDRATVDLGKDVAASDATGLLRGRVEEPYRERRRAARGGATSPSQTFGRRPRPTVERHRQAVQPGEPGRASPSKVVTGDTQPPDRRPAHRRLARPRRSTSRRARTARCRSSGSSGLGDQSDSTSSRSSCSSPGSTSPSA